MAGKFSDNGKNNVSSDILFDLTPEDDKKLQESDLLQLVNYGQLSKDIKVIGTHGKYYNVEIALLWDEDYLDIVKKTTQYASDAILRVKALRRLKLFKAIQKIDNHDYSDETNMVSQRELWTVLCRLADSQIEYLDAKYNELEFERNLSVSDAIRELTEMTIKENNPGMETIPDNGSIKKQPTDSNTTKDVPKDEHTELFANVTQQREEKADAIATAVIKEVEGDIPTSDSDEAKPAIIKSPNNRKSNAK